jgi:pimeloyl-ACP methyl ester carboxylesterase
MKRVIVLLALGGLVAVAAPNAAGARQAAPQRTPRTASPGAARATGEKQALVVPREGVVVPVDTPFTTEVVDHLGQQEVQQCKDATFKVALAPNAPRQYNLWGRLCGPAGDLNGRTIMVLVHGGTYNHHYNDWPYRPEYYSFVRAATAAGYATLNIDKVGHGNSDHRPSSMEIDFPSSAHSLHDVVQDLRSGATGVRFGKTIFVGHSMGETSSRVLAAYYPDDVDGLIISGAQHLGNYVKIATVAAFINYPANADPLFADRPTQPGDATSMPGKRCEVFYHPGSVEPEVCALDEKLKDTVSAGEWATFHEFSNVTNTQKIKAPVLHVMGEYDAFWCVTTCSNPYDFAQNEYRFYPASACFEAWTEPNSGHMNNLHLGAPAYYAKAMEWADRRVGKTSDAPVAKCGS